MALQQLKTAIATLGKSGSNKKDKQLAATFSKDLLAAVTKALQATSKKNVDVVMSLMGSEHAPDIYFKIGLPMFKVAAELINEIWKNRIYPCLDKAEGNDKVRQEKDMWEKLLDEGVIAGLQVFNDEHGEKLVRAPFAETLYPPLANILIDDKASLAAVFLRKQVAGLLCDTAAKHTDCKRVLLKPTVLGSARLGEAIADAYSYALLDPLFELVSRIMTAPTDIKMQTKICKDCVRCDKMRRTFGEEACDSFLEVLQNANENGWQPTIKSLIGIMAKQDIKR
ncbi:hypothetical protein CALVIDRAFT_394780 [Calocera viscosa TUFC12733]|uniref:Uncharacterized protein n=1 Tax=Calocera viscosa (strain TUFC12733) TaxID=1330018 RepID=A0A167GBP7_CALVF|nr:hypothetical protein CALVIDRAFT_394780 [Calocera viscosa TUFC12733]